MKPYEIAFQEFNVKEVPGKENNPRILEYFKTIGHEWVDSELAWCSAFVNYCALKSGAEFTGKLNAKSWLNVGKQVKTPILGDVVVFWRVNPNSWQGHVAFYLGQDEKYIYVLGGNQDNKVCIKEYPKYMLIGYRRLYESDN